MMKWLEKYDFFDSEKFRFYFDKENYKDLSFSKYRKVYETKERIVKIARQGELDREVLGLKILGEKNLAPKLIDQFRWGRFHIIVMEKVEGENLIQDDFLAHPETFVEEYARCLYTLHHQVEFDDAHKKEIKDRFPDENLQKIEDFYRREAICDTMLRRNYNLSIDEGMKYIRDNYSQLVEESIIHGDVCLPNIIFKDGSFFKFIDLDGFGVYDYHYDIFWALWTLIFNLGTDEYREMFIDAYGREFIDEDRLKLCGIISCLLSEKGIEELT